MLKIGQVIQLNGKTGVVLQENGNDILVLKSGVRQPEWIKLDFLRIFNKGI